MPAPNLDDVRSEDLRDVGRLLILHGQAVAKGLASPSEDGRLKFVAAAEHARAVGSINPSGLFARIVRAGLWRYLTADDEDSARRRLGNHLYGQFCPLEARRLRPIPIKQDREMAPTPRLGDVLGGLLARLKVE